MKSLKLCSAPGPDGIPSSCMKLFWSILGYPLRATMNYYANTGILPSDYLTGRLKLILKNGSATELKSWRPITILNIRYKLYSIMYTNRRRVVARLVGRSQKGFSSICRAHEALVNLSELINQDVESDAASCAIRFDFASAFDKVDHGYTLAVMRLFGFLEKMIGILTLMTR